MRGVGGSKPVAPPRARRERLGLLTELLVRRAFQLLNVLLLLNTVHASTELVMIWDDRILLVKVMGAAWLVGIAYLWMRASFQLPRFWCVTPLAWSVVLLLAAAHIPQTLRFRLLGDEALTTYMASSNASGEIQPVDATIGSYHILGAERIDGAFVLHAGSKADWRKDGSECAALVYLEPAEQEASMADTSYSTYRKLSGNWWLLNFGTRGAGCEAMFNVTIHPSSASR